MQKLFLLFFISIGVSSSAQNKLTGEVATESTIGSPIIYNPSSVAKWTFTNQKQTEDNQFLITAKLNLAKDWHIFDFESGGDGMLIAPEFSFEGEGIKIIKQEAIGTLMTEKIEGVDSAIRYYENEVSFKLIVWSKKKEIRGAVYYQVCDHGRCLPPTEEKFTLTVQ